MENVSGKAPWAIQAAGMPLLTTILVLVASLARSQEAPKHASTEDVAKDKQAAASPTPRDVYRAYLFLQSRLRSPVVDKTGLAGYYSFEIADKTVRVGLEKDKTEPLDHTGLQLHWERTKTKVVVIKDK